MANIAIYTFNSDTDTLPVFNEGYEYSYTDVINNDDTTTTRTITSDSLPTSISFQGCTGLVSLSYLDTSGLTSMNSMFEECDSLISIDCIFDTSNITNMNRMFYGCGNILSIKGIDTWDVSNVNTMAEMFYNSGIKSVNLTGWDTGNVTNMHSMFGICSDLASIYGLNTWDTSIKNTIYGY